MKKLFAAIMAGVTLFSLTAFSSGCEFDDASFNVIFFDTENEMSKNGESYTHLYGTEGNTTVAYTSAQPAECYMIKSGNTEILVDAGFRLYGDVGSDYNARVAKIYRDNIVKKIDKYCTDNVLEYLIVTHGDYDHIAGLAADGGLLDYYLTEPNKKIERIIDFDSDLVVYLSNENGNDIYPSGKNNFYDSLITINKYREKRDNLVNQKGVIHLPAAALFKMSDLRANTLVNAMPDKWRNNYFVRDKNDNLTTQVNTTLLTNFLYFSNDIIYRQNGTSSGAEDANLNFISSYNGELGVGELKEQNSRYYYSIPIEDGAELRILYNWSYDHFYRHSFDSQDRNNISVCIQVVNGNYKYTAFGDLGFGETGLINYYKDTDILKGVTCFKASHHGSTTNGENSSALYKLMNSPMVAVTGVAQINRDILEESKMTTDVIYSRLSTTAVMKQAFFDNVLSGNKETKIYCTQITKSLNDKGSEVITAPLCGDIIVHLGKEAYAESTYKGEVEGYVSSYSDKAKHFKFSNYSDGKLLSYMQTEYWDAIYNKKGKV